VARNAANEWVIEMEWDNKTRTFEPISCITSHGLIKKCLELVRTLFLENKQLSYNDASSLWAHLLERDVQIRHGVDMPHDADAGEVISVQSFVDTFGCDPAPAWQAAIDPSSERARSEIIKERVRRRHQRFNLKKREWVEKMEKMYEKYKGRSCIIHEKVKRPSILLGSDDESQDGSGDETK